MINRLYRTSGLLILSCIFLLTVNISLGYVLTKQSDAAMRTQIESRMLDISNTAAALLDGDALEIVEAGDVDTPAYQGVLRTLSYFQQNIDLEYIYCIRDNGDGHFSFTIDPSDDPGEFGEEIAYTDALYQASLGTPGVDKVPYGDRWGRFYSAYTPVFNSKGQVAGIVGVDFSASWYEEKITTLWRSTILITAISLLVAGGISFLLISRYRKRFYNILDEMNAVSDGIETLVHEVSPGMELNAHNEDLLIHSADGITELGDRIRSLETQLSEQISFVRSQAYVDGLTGLAKRTAYEDQVKQLDREIEDGTASFTVVLFDLNGLKEINDRHGHEAGDRAITDVADALRQAFPDGMLYRIGGDEFVVILDESRDDVDALLSGFDRALEERNTATVAKGCAVCTPDTELGFREVFKRADDAMYEDKRNYYLTNKDRKAR